jgi:outer membrane protein OmpA-like peptidoglycan-associated protein
MVRCLRKTGLAFLVFGLCLISISITTDVSAASGALVVVLVDTSSSMKKIDPSNRRRAALELLSGLANSSTRLAVVGFSEEARILVPPAAMGSFGSPTRKRLGDATLALSATGGPAIGDALRMAGSLIGAEQGATVLLLSNGIDSKNRWSGQSDMLPASTVVHAVSLWSDASREALVTIARETGGVFEIARTPDDLARILSTLLARAQREQTTILREARISPGDVHSYSLEIEPGTTTAYAALDWPGSDIDLSLTAPDGRVIDSASAVAMGQGVEAGTFDVIRLDQPAPGRWKVEVKAVRVAPKGEPYTLRAGVAGSDLRFGWQVAGGGARAGAPVIIAPRPNQPVRWLRTRATVRDGNGQIIFRSRVPYRADAGFEIPAIEKVGDHLVRLEVDGEITGGGRFSRVFDRTIAIGSRRTTAKPVTAGRVTVVEPAYVNPNALVLQLAPGYREAYGLEDDPSVDLDIRFGYDSATLEPVSMRQLGALGEAMNADALRDAKFEIIGHTDAKGTASYNMSLSEKRAGAVRAYLIDRLKVGAELITAVGRGETDLKDTLFPEAAINRRVEVRVISKSPAKPASRTPVTAAPGPAESSGTGTINWGAGGASGTAVDRTPPDQSEEKSGGKIKW